MYISLAFSRYAKVSIPYGKGKDDVSREILSYIKAYQFPMGKVKKGYIKDINSNKKSNVSIPYGKGKEQHFVLRFYYNP